MWGTVWRNCMSEKHCLEHNTRDPFSLIWGVLLTSKGWTLKVSLNPGTLILMFMPIYSDLHSLHFYHIKSLKEKHVTTPIMKISRNIILCQNLHLPIQGIIYPAILELKQSKKTRVLLYGRDPTPNISPGLDSLHYSI